MKKQKIPFDFSKFGQEGISVDYLEESVIALHKHPNEEDLYYGIFENGCFIGLPNELKMYQEIKPREIWVNEYTNGLSATCMWYDSEKEAAECKSATHYVKSIKFREVLDDEQ